MSSGVALLSLNTHAAGVCNLVNSAAVLLARRLPSAICPAILVPALIGELSFAVWLTVKGVNAAGWQRAGQPIARS
jgi:hypothetical protein